MSEANNPIIGYADTYRAMARQGKQTVEIWSVITDLERNMAPLMDAAQSELAALREELAGYKHDIASFLETTAKVCNLLGIDTEDAKNADGKPSDVLFSHAEALRQRNAELESQLRHFASCADVRQVGTLAMDFVAGLTKPTESGASE